MPLSLHEITVPMFRQTLAAFSAVLDKAEAHCRANDVDPAAFLEKRLAPDMYTLAMQVQRASTHAAQCVAKLARVDTPQHADDEKTFDELRRRIAATREFIGAFKPGQFDGAEAREVEIPTRVRTLTFTGRDYLLHFAIPQFLFHVTTGYDIIRNAGVEVGKRDFLGDPSER